MLYHAYQAHSDLMAPVKALRGGDECCAGPRRDARKFRCCAIMSAAYEMIDRAG